MSDDLMPEVWGAVAATLRHEREQVLLVLSTMEREELVTFAALSVVALTGESLRATDGEVTQAHSYAREQAEGRRRGQ